MSDTADRPLQVGSGIDADRTPTAFVPAHVTGFFTAEPADDPTEAGSTGAGLALSDGVTVRVEPATPGTYEVTLDGESLDIAAPKRVLRALRVDGAHVRARSEVPLASGFGVSGALALGTALCANAVFDRELSENELVTVAHGAEVQAGTGLGDVVAQARGGVPVRLEPGAPGQGFMDGIPARSRVEYVTLGELSTEAVLSGDTDLLSHAGQRALSALVQEPTLERFVRSSRRFAREAELLTDRVRDVVLDVSEADGSASMAMLGETVFALGTGLSDAGHDPAVCRIHPTGAHLTLDGW
ncbi:pantoate kinase [Haloglomus litoreum]|uniref:pantoate kinase n=1 Tax=Haloglomus litoreum TaxID=3034026 RepID=UPI0023E7BB59|nr:pantoate kinase [Haloglomus sp. DT116]